MADELTQFVQDSLEDEELVMSLNSVGRLLQEKTPASQEENIKDYFFEQSFCINTLVFESDLIY